MNRYPQCTRSFLTLAALSLVCLSWAQSSVDKLIMETRDALARQRSVSYKAELRMKFTNMPDTFSFVEDVKLQRVEGDTVIGGKVLFTEGDSAFTTYNGTVILECDMKTDSCVRYTAAKDHTWQLQHNMRTMIIWRDFLDPSSMDKTLKPDRQRSQLPDTVLSGQTCWHIRSKRPDDGEAKDATTDLYISQQDHAVLLEVFRVVVQGDVQYSWRRILTHSFGTPVDMDFELGARFANAMVSDHRPYVPEPMLSVGEIAPPLLGEVYGSAPEPDSLPTSGQVTFVDFWYMSCPPCRTSTPVVDSLHAVYKERGVRFVGVNTVDKANGNLGLLPSFLKNRPVHYPLLIADMAIETAYRVSGHPAFYIIDKDGRIAAAFEGYGRGTEKKWAAVLDRLLSDN